MSNKLNSSIKKIDKVFNSMQSQRKSVKKGKVDSDSTINQYRVIVQKYAERIHQDFGISNLRKWNEDHFMKYVDTSVDQWKKGNLSVAYQIKQLRSALVFFQHATEVTNVFREKINCIDEKRVEETFKYNHIKRISEATHTLAATQKEGQLILDEIQKSRSKHKDIAYHAFKISMETGARMMDIEKITRENIDFERKNITFENSKGGLTGSVPISEETVSYLKKLTEGKNNKTPIIRSYREKNGKYSPMGNSSNRATIARIISKAGEKSGANGFATVSYKYRDDKGNTKIGTTFIEKRISHHSARKIFTNERYSYYKSLSRSELDKELHERLKEAEVYKKYQIAVNRLNKNRNTHRDMYHHEKAIFVTSLDSRHFRNDVLTGFYLLRAVVREDRAAARKNNE